MIRNNFERELQHLQDEVLRLASEVEENLTRATDALRRRDFVRSQQLIEADRWVNERRITIVMDCLTLIATQQPAAGDLRRLAATLEIVGELERIHDYVKGISKISLMINDQMVPTAVLQTLPQMAEKACTMLHNAMNAFAYRDAALARTIPQADHEVDTLYNQYYRDILNYVVNNPTAMEHASYLEWAVHNLERTADRAINICEWVVYMITGSYAELDQVKTA